MKEVSIQYPDGLPQTLKLSDREFGEEVRFLAAVKLFELGKLSAGKAAELAGLPRLTFLSRLATVGVAAINLRDEEVEAAAPSRPPCRARVEEDAQRRPPDGGRSPCSELVQHGQGSALGVRVGGF